MTIKTTKEFVTFAGGQVYHKLKMPHRLTTRCGLQAAIYGTPVVGLFTPPPTKRYCQNCARTGTIQ